ncbi:glycosyltransferase family 4 protein [Ornithinibacillus bavariensis]|uniref:Glycosyltransferase WbuB n=1 Tax=Ornithinibacillus bavariensis TaxID=545502 RepID=A0A919XA42_9BACI|nr:glycosyltransferase family 4 protein [Ornithinibacillus bavariensis]GIO26915.1 glycosyltransferase WbuB [Ornithinibacillus bavariensis]
MTKKVLIMTQNFYPVIGSAGNRMKNIFQLLNKNNIETRVLTIEPSYPNKNLYKNKEFWDDEELNNETKNIIRVPIKNKKFSSSIFSRLFFYLEIMVRFIVTLWKIRKEKFDYILVSTPPIFIVFSAFIGKFLTKSKVILEVRDLWPDSLLGVKAFDSRLTIRFFRYLERRMYQKADAIVINSKGFEKHITDKIRHAEKPIVYIPNGPRENEITSNREFDREFSVVYTGNIGLAQDIDRLKAIAKSLHEHNIVFNVIGYGIKAGDFADYLEKNNLIGVRVYKPTTRKKSLDLIRQSNIAIAFLNDEGVFSTVLPGKIIDYITCKTPVVAGVKGTAAELINNNKVGFAFESRDVDKMIHKIIELKQDSNKLKELAENCEKVVKQEFLWETNISKLIGIIESK